MWISFITFIFIEILLGVFIGKMILGKFVSIHLNFMIQGLLNLLSYFIGGIIIGFISPGIRRYEPAMGAFLSVALMLILTFFTPYSFLQFSLTKLLIGGLIAFMLALTGSSIGERLSGNKF